jgi:hypothetical protein
VNNARGADTTIAGLGLTEQEIVDAYIYVLARYLVIRQEQLDIAEEGIDYNRIKYNELGKAEFVNPNLDVAYLEAWLAVDEHSAVVLEVPQVLGRYYTVQIVDEWAEILYNLNERTLPEHSYGTFALCLRGSSPDLPAGALRLDLPSRKAKLLARVERKGDDAGAMALQRAFRITPTSAPAIAPTVAIPQFTNAAPLTVEVFAQPLLAQVLDSASDAMALGAAMRARAEAIAAAIAQNQQRRDTVDGIIRRVALPALVQFIRTYGDQRGGWIATTGKELGFGEDYWFRTAANYAGIWWNNNREVVYYVGQADAAGTPLTGDHSYCLHFPAGDLPQQHVDAYWSLTLLSLPDYRVVPNALERFSFNNLSPLALEPDGALKIYVGATPPMRAPASNWLPAPVGRPFTLTLRLYVPKPEVLTGAYYAPPIERYP